MANILLVEDDQLSAICTIQLLEECGHSVHHATDTDDALELINKYKHDILLSDWIVDGSLSALQIVVRAKQMNPALKVFFTTGYPADMIKSELPESSSYSIFTKPIDFDRLLKEL